MKNLRLLAILLGVVSSALAQDIVESSRVLDAAGGIASNEQFSGVQAICQPNPLGFSANDKFLNSAGFLHSDTITSSVDADSDADGLSDWDELTGTSFTPTTPTAFRDSDTDGNGQSDGDESIAGTNPLNESNFFGFVSTASGEGQNVVVWQSRGGRTYTLLTSETMGGLNTNPVVALQGMAAGGIAPWFETTMAYTNPVEDHRFFKVQTP